MTHLKAAVVLLLFVQAFGSVSPQSTTARPTIDPSWLREESNLGNGVEEEAGQDNMSEFNSGTSSGAMEDDNMIMQRGVATEATGQPNATESPAVQNATVKTESASPAAATSANSSMDASQSEAANNVTSTVAPQSVPAVTDSSNGTNATAAPGAMSTAKPEATATARPDAESKNTTGASNATVATSNTGTETNETSTGSTAVPGNQATATSAPPTTASEDRMDQSTGDPEGRGSALDPQRNARQQAWGAVLATAVVVACVGLVAYVVMKKKYPKGFSHRKLVEEYPSDPVLRLDNSEPLDLNFGQLGYHNPGHQGDDIQMGRIPRRQN
ncbi:unnamed protein product [Ophioblennius macclurei]